MAVSATRMLGRSSNSTYQYTLKSDNIADLRKWASKLADEMKMQSALTDVDTDQQENGVQTMVRVDPDTAKRLGIGASGVDAALYNAFGRPVRQDRTGAAGGDVGQEIDVIFNAHLTDRQDVLVTYSHFFPGAFIKATGPSNPGNAVYVQYSWRW